MLGLIMLLELLQWRLLLSPSRFPAKTGLTFRKMRPLDPSTRYEWLVMPPEIAFALMLLPRRAASCVMWHREPAGPQ
jgi:hypothetical protein